MIEHVEYRTAATLEVRHAARIIDMIAVPYDEPTDVLRRGRWVTETVDPEAFAGVHGSVTVNRAHDLEAPLGRVATFHPNDPRGLRTEIRISRTSSGDDVLELAADGLLSPSIGFSPLPGGEVWTHDRSAVRVTRAKLVHIALTGDPAYKGAKVLAVRTGSALAQMAEYADALRSSSAPAPVPTPNLDRIRLESLASAAGFDLPSPS